MYFSGEKKSLSWQVWSSYKNPFQTLRGLSTKEAYGFQIVFFTLANFLTDIRNLCKFLNFLSKGGGNIFDIEKDKIFHESFSVQEVLL